MADRPRRLDPPEPLSARPGLGRAVVRWCAAAILLLLAAWFLVPSVSRYADECVQVVSGLLATAACLGWVTGTRPSRAWRFAGMASAAWTAGTVLDGILQLGLHRTSRPSLADPLFVACSVFAVRAVLAFPSTRRTGVDTTRAVLDGLVISGALTVLIALSPVRAVIAGPHGSLAGSVTALAYPIVDALIVAMLLSSVSRLPRDESRCLSWAAVGITGLAATNLLEYVLADRGTVGFGATAHLGFVVSFAAVALGGSLQRPKSPEITPPGLTLRLVPDLPVLAMLLVAAVVGVPDRATGTGLVVVLALVVVRHVVVSLAHERLTREMATAQRRIAQSEHRYRKVVETAEEGIWLTSADGTTQLVNARTAELIGIPAEELLGRNAVDVLEPMVGRLGLEEIARRRERRSQGHADRYPITATRPDGSEIVAWISAAPLYDDQGDYEGSITFITDVTEQSRLQDELTAMAFADPLTSLPNRSLFTSSAEEALASAAEHGRTCAVLFLDLDGFKSVNDTLGHLAGDELLRLVAERLLGSRRPDDTIARMGGDEFAILVDSVADAAAAQRVADRLLASLARPFDVQGRQVYVSGSIGIAIAEPGDDVDHLLRNADLAMYRAKGSGRDRHCLYEPSMHVDLTRRIGLEDEIRQSLAEGRFVVHYQPIVDLATGACEGVEALVRWEHPTRGLLAPAEFIAVCEESSLIVALGRSVLEQACADAAEVRAEGGRFVLSVNVAARQLSDPAFVDDLRALLTATATPTEQFILEITERGLLDGVGVGPTLSTLRSLGVRIALDDFGTGYSSLGHLREFPVDILKLDRSYVDGVASDPSKRAIAESVIRIGRALDLRLLAEGIEREEDRQVVQAAGAVRGQGYLFARPMPLRELHQWLRTHRLDLDGAGRRHDAVNVRWHDRQTTAPAQRRWSDNEWTSPGT